MATRINQTALVTGASNGIGLDFARQLAERGYDLVLVARSRDKLEALARELESQHGVHTQVIAVDLAEPHAPERVLAEVRAAGSKVDVLINNAGYATYGRFTETPADDELAMIHLNVVALTALAKAVLPEMVSRGSGKVLNVASTAAFQPGPLMAVYYATKAYVLSLSEALACEVEGTGATVTALCPGPTRSGFQARAKMEESKLVKGKEIMDSATVARAGIEGMLAGKAVVIPGFMNKVLAGSVRFLPRQTVTRIVRRTQDRAQA